MKIGVFVVYFYIIIQLYTEISNNAFVIRILICFVVMVLFYCIDDCIVCVVRCALCVDYAALKCVYVYMHGNNCRKKCF